MNTLYAIMITTMFNGIPVPYSLPTTTLEECQAKIEIIKKSWMKTANCAEITIKDVASKEK